MNQPTANTFTVCPCSQNRRKHKKKFAKSHRFMDLLESTIKNALSSSSFMFHAADECRIHLFDMFDEMCAFMPTSIPLQPNNHHTFCIV